MSSSENPHAGQGMVVLDIGGAVGALTVSAPAAMAGLEIEICPSGARDGVPDEGGDWWVGEWRGHAHAATGSHPHDHGQSHDHDHDHGHSHGSGPAWPHVEILARPVPGAVAYSAVFPGLHAGRYDLWLRPDGPTALTVHVTGAQVASAAWPAMDG